MPSHSYMYGKECTKSTSLRLYLCLNWVRILKYSILVYRNLNQLLSGIQLVIYLLPHNRYSNGYHCFCVCSKQVMLEPVILPECGHTYCKSCATRVTNTGPKHCPNCRTPIKSAMITNFTVKTLVLKIRATCNRCQTVEELESLLIHRCPEEELNCSNNGCNEKYKRKDKRAHTDVCQYEIIKCHQCHEDTTGAAKEVHLTQQCKEGRINCPLMCRMRPKRYQSRCIVIYINYFL